MELWWECPICGERVNFTEEMQSGCFDNKGEAEFDPQRGIYFHTLFCKCGARWVMSLSEVNCKL